MSKNQEDVERNYRAYYADYKGERWEFDHVVSRCPTCGKADAGKPPARGLQFITQTDPKVGAYMQTKADFYVLVDGEWTGMNIAGLFDYFLETGTVIVGRLVPSEVYNKIFQEAKALKQAWIEEWKEGLKTSLDRRVEGS